MYIFILLENDVVLFLNFS